MASREAITVTRQAPAESRPAPNRVVPQITVEIRAHYPAGMGHEDAVLLELHRAMVDLKYQMLSRSVPHASPDNR